MSSDERELLKWYRMLDAGQRELLRGFAAYLAQRGRQQPARAEADEPEPLPRPASETVVAAIKRLSATYHMLDSEKLLHQAAGLLAEHTLQGRPAGEVIDELETLFARHYGQLRGDIDAR